MRFYTFKNFNNVTQFMNEKQTFKMRSILRIATVNGTLSKCSEKRFEIAKKVYTAVKTLNRYRENELYFDSIWQYEQRQFYTNIQNDLLEKIKPLLKQLSITIESGTWWHLTTLDNQTIYLS